MSRKSICISIIICILLLGMYLSTSGIVHVSNTVNGKELPIYSVEMDEKKVALTFDAAWGNEETKKILEILEKYNIKTTFFMTGGWVDEYPEDVKLICQKGHDLANHSQSHKNMSLLEEQECRQELMQVHEKVKELTDVEMEFFRPPYGDYDDEVIHIASSCGYQTIQWDVDTIDIKVMTNAYHCAIMSIV